MEKKFLTRYMCILGALLVICAGLVVFLDPFYHFHGKLPFLKAVLDDRDYQVKGTLDHFDYDAVVLGTSLAENTNTDVIKNNFNLTAVKAIRAGGSNADLLFYLNDALDKQEVKRVFYYLDYASMTGGMRDSFKDSDEAFIINNNPFDDCKYIFNKDVLLNKIVKQVAYSTIVDYNEAEPYCWYAEKTFSEAEILSRYSIEEAIEQNQIDDTDFVANISEIEEIIKSHPDTQFDIILPPVSILWWDYEYRCGNLDVRMSETKYLTDKLGIYQNVNIYNFQFDEDIVKNLDNYMDTVHFSNIINNRIYEEIANGREASEAETVQAECDIFRETVIHFSNEEIYEYYSVK